MLNRKLTDRKRADLNMHFTAALNSLINVSGIILWIFEAFNPLARGQDEQKTYQGYLS